MGRGREEELWTALHGYSSINGVPSVASLRSLWTLGPGESLSTRQSFTPYNVWEENNGATVGDGPNSLEQLQTDAAAGDSNAILETASLGIYRAGTQVQTAGGMWGRSAPEGDQFYELGYGREGGESYIYHRDYADDYRIAFSNEASGESEISRNAGHLDPGAKNTVGHAEVYGIDPLDGSGPSGITLDAASGYVRGFRIGWYGPSVTVPYIAAVGDFSGEWRQNTWPICLIDPVGEPLISRPNEPFHFAAHNNGTTGNALDMRVGGRQFSYAGEINAGRRDLTHQTPEMTLPMDGTGSGPNDLYVVAVVKRKAGFEETAATVGRVEVDTGNTMALHARVLPETDINGTLSYENPSDTFGETAYVQIDAQADTPDRLTLSTETDPDALDEDATKVAGVKWGGRFVGSDTAVQQTAVGDAGRFELQLVRDHPTVIVARTNDGNTATASFSIGLPGIE
jgi:hypothetical protein